MNSKVYLYEQLHKENIGYGTGAIELEEEISVLIEMLQPKVVLDYGCGKGKLVRLLSKKYPQIAFFGYDPAIPEMSDLPVTHADLIINTDVLEHIPEDELPSTIEKIRNISKNVFLICTMARPFSFYKTGKMHIVQSKIDSGTMNCLKNILM